MLPCSTSSTIVKILGSGCANSKRTKTLVNQVVGELNLDAQVEEVTDIATIMGYGVMSTPTIVIDEKVVGSRNYGEKSNDHICTNC